MNFRGKVETVKDVFPKLNYETQTHIRTWSGAEDIFDPNYKGAIQNDAVMMFMMRTWTAGRYNSRVRKEVLYVEMCGMKFPNHHHFTGIFERKSQQLFDAGFFQWLEHEIEYATSQAKYKHLYWWLGRPRVLDMRMLEPGFVIWMASFSLAFLAFALEWIALLKNYFVAKYVLCAFFQTKSFALSESAVKTVETPRDSFNEVKASEDSSQRRIDVCVKRTDSIDDLLEVMLS